MVKRELPQFRWKNFLTSFWSVCGFLTETNTKKKTRKAHFKKEETSILLSEENNTETEKQLQK